MTDDYLGLPEGLRGGAQRWIENGIQPGGFLSAVITNNLVESFGRADDNNGTKLFEIIGWFYNEAPSRCWGSLEKAEKWAKFYKRGFKFP